jgi:hypothetical protein
MNTLIFFYLAYISYLPPVVIRNGFVNKNPIVFLLFLLVIEFILLFVGFVSNLLVYLIILLFVCLKSQAQN